MLVLPWKRCERQVGGKDADISVMLIQRVHKVWTKPGLTNVCWPHSSFIFTPLNSSNTFVLLFPSTNTSNLLDLHSRTEVGQMWGGCLERWLWWWWTVGGGDRVSSDPSHEVNHYVWTVQDTDAASFFGIRAAVWMSHQQTPRTSMAPRLLPPVLPFSQQLRFSLRTICSWQQFLRSKTQFLIWKCLRWGCRQTEHFCGAQSFHSISSKNIDTCCVCFPSARALECRKFIFFAFRGVEKYIMFSLFTILKLEDKQRMTPKKYGFD